MPGSRCHHQHDCLQVFWYMTVAGAAWTGVIKSYSIAFEPDPGMQ